MVPKKGPGLWTAIGIGVGTMIGSGWLFSAYYAAQYVGPASLFSWVIGAVISLVLALLLAEIAGMYKIQALFSRLITISHENPDFGFVIAISGWLCLVLVTPTEASATIQYLSTLFPSFTDYFFINQQHTFLGSVCIIALVILYSALNFWGIRTFANVSNTLAIFKIVIPILTALILITASFHPSNFVSHGFASYGTSRVFSGVIVCGIFYAFYGFSLVAMYGAELKNPQKNIPRALVISVLICFFIYGLLQVAFIGGVPPELIATGWAQLNFTSPLAQLLMVLDMHILTLWTMVLYFDATLSPSGSAMICLSSATRTVTGMAQDNQFPKVFDKIHPIYHISRPSLIFTTIICCFVLLFFKNWKELMILVSVFQLTSCVAIPIAFVKLRKNKPDMERIYQVKLGTFLSYIVFMLLTLFLVQVDVWTLVIALGLYLAFFTLYLVNYYRANVRKMLHACYSSWSIFMYIVLAIIFGYLNQIGLLTNQFIVVGFVVLMSLIFWFLINQKNYNPGKSREEECV